MIYKSIFSLKTIKSISIQDRINYTALLVFIIAAFYSIGHYKSDEHYQILEFAQYKLGQINAKDLPWEFDAKMRPSFQPWLVVGMVSLLKVFNITNPFAITTIFRLITALLLWFITKKLNKLLIERYFTQNSWAILFSCCTFFLWYVPFISVRFSSENYAGLFLMASIYFIIKDFKSIRNLLSIGLCLGIAILFKAQIGLAVLGIFGWLIFIGKISIYQFTIMSLAILSVTALGTYLDYLFYGSFVFTPFYFIMGNLEGG